MPYLSNVDVFLAMAEESYAAMQEAMSAGRTPKSDGSGYIITYDATRAAFKYACIVIAFSAMFFEALTYLLSLQRFGKAVATKIDRMPYEERLVALGVTDPGLLTMAKEFRGIRKELVHEKAVELGQAIDPAPRYAQHMADKAMKFVAALKGQFVAA